MTVIKNDLEQLMDLLKELDMNYEPEGYANHMMFIYIYFNKVKLILSFVQGNYDGSRLSESIGSDLEPRSIENFADVLRLLELSKTNSDELYRVLKLVE
jgi:hypothetical protein